MQQQKITIQRDHYLFGIVSSILPFKGLGHPMRNDHSMAVDGLMTGGRITVSRNFTTSGDGKSLLHQTLDTKVVGRDSGAPLRTTLNAHADTETLPDGLL